MKETCDDEAKKLVAKIASVRELYLLKSNSVCFLAFKVDVFMPTPFKNGGGALSVTPVRACVRLSVIKIWCPLNNLIKFGMLIYNIQTQVEFDLGYNPIIFDGVMGFL